LYSFSCLARTSITSANGNATAAIRYLITRLPSVAHKSTLISMAMSEGDPDPSREQVGSRKNCNREPDEAKGEAGEGR
jgi:hypothetical protein